MKRKALIIGNSGEPEEYLEGVKKDVQNYGKFLKSNMGGKWYENEIMLSLDETKEQVGKNVENDIPFEKTVIAMESLGERYKFHKNYRAMYQEIIIKCPNNC